MSEVDAFRGVFKEDAREHGYSINMAAKEIHKSRRQLIRDVGGDNKLGIMPIDVLALLAQRGVISDKTVDEWWRTVRRELNFKAKKRKPGIISRLLKKIA